ncbi:hypothetical protein MKW98_003669 [Papaver atlanticum]|uniref:Uncharacterized protein n=1 Tax=Papaver atlanticum TaxID=357466 RepID=A0AAD4SHU8_9MAGN|nr:hypothetical protein MKW98_003669 [Papaver atlanticum]
MGYQQAHTGNAMEVDLHSNNMEVDQNVGVLAEVVTPTEGIYPVPAPTSELTRGVEAVAEVTVSSATKEDKFPVAGGLYAEGRHCEKVQDEEFEDVGGFSVQKTHAPLYKQIWLKYGHIASNQVLPDSYYYSQVVVVSELMSFIVDMNRYPFEEVSSDVIDSWEKNVKVAEKLEFNIGWLRERLEDIKIAFAEEKKLKEMLAEQDQAKARAIEAEQLLVLAKERLSALETKIPLLLTAKQNFRNKCGSPLLLFNSPVTAPVQEDANLIEEPIDNNNSKTVPSTRDVINLSPVKAPVQEDAIPIEEPIDNNSKTVPSTRDVRNLSPVKAPVQEDAIPIEEPIDDNNSKTVPSIRTVRNLSPVKAPVQEDAIPTEEPIDNKNSKTVPSRGTVRKTRLVSSLNM